MRAHTSKPLSFAMTLDENLDGRCFVRRCTTGPDRVSQCYRWRVLMYFFLGRRQGDARVKEPMLLICRDLRKLDLVVKA